MQAKQLEEIYGLLNALREDVISDADFERLDFWISNDVRACRLYVDYVKLWADLQGFQLAANPDYALMSTDAWQSGGDAFVDSQFWKMLAEHEKTGKAIVLSKEPPQHELIQKVIYSPREKQKISKFQLFTLIASAAAVLTILLYVHYPVRKSVATLTQSAHARWADADRPMEIGTRLYEQELLFLKQGAAKIVFDSDAEVVLEAPVLIKLQNKGKVGLDLGRLYAYVPKQAIGFTVNTPHASFIDLGTEFGVNVDNSDKIQTRVYQGEVAVQVGSDSNLFKEAVIGAGKVGLVDLNGVLSITEFSMQHLDFIRSVEQYQSEQSLLNCNLIVNGDFENDAVTYDPQHSESQNLSENNVMLSGWNDRGPATINTYDVLGDMPVPPDKGKNFFIGYQPCTIDQEISVTDLSYKINRGSIRYELSGWIGGWEVHEDHLEITASFLDDSDKLIGSAQIGPVTAEERNFQTRFVERVVRGILPSGVRKIVIRLRSVHGSGETTDAYADNLKFVLSSND